MASGETGHGGSADPGAEHLPAEPSPGGQSGHPPQRHFTIPSLTEIGAFAALGLDTDAPEAEVREAYRMLRGIHSSAAGRSSETLLRLEEALRVALLSVAQRVRPGVSEVGR